MKWMVGALCLYRPTQLCPRRRSAGARRARAQHAPCVARGTGAQARQVWSWLAVTSCGAAPGASGSHATSNTCKGGDIEVSD